MPYFETTGRGVTRGAFVALTIAALAACGEESLPSGVTPDQAVGRLRVVNAVADPARGDRVNITVANTPLAVNIAYGAVAPALGVQPNPAPYYPIYVGTWPLAIRRTADTSIKVLDETLDIAANTDYTVIVLGQASGVSVRQLTDDNAAPAEGTVRLRVVHSSLSAPGTVDIYVTSTTADITTLQPTAANVPMGGATPYLSLAPGVHRVRVTAAGSKTTVLDTNLPSLAAGAARTVLMLDRAAGGLPATASVLADR